MVDSCHGACFLSCSIQTDTKICDRNLFHLLEKKIAVVIDHKQGTNRRIHVGGKSDYYK